MIKYNFKILGINFDREYISIELIPEGDLESIKRNLKCDHDKLLQIFTSEDRDFIKEKVTEIVAKFDGGFQGDFERQVKRKATSISPVARAVVDNQEVFSAKAGSSMIGKKQQKPDDGVVKI